MRNNTIILTLHMRNLTLGKTRSFFLTLARPVRNGTRGREQCSLLYMIQSFHFKWENFRVLPGQIPQVGSPVQIILFYRIFGLHKIHVFALQRHQPYIVAHFFLKQKRRYVIHSTMLEHSHPARQCIRVFFWGGKE